MLKLNTKQVRDLVGKGGDLFYLIFCFPSAEYYCYQIYIYWISECIREKHIF